MVVVLLALFGMGVTVASQLRLRSELDADLVRRGLEAARLGPPPDRPGPRESGSVPAEYRGLFDPARRVANIREPKFIDRQGHRMRHRPPLDDMFDFEDPGPPTEIVPAVDPEGLQRALRGQPGHRTVTIEGEPVRVYTQPMKRQGEIIGAVQLARELRDLDDLAKSQIWTFAFFLPVAGLAAGGAAVLLANRALKPVAGITRAASEIGGADLSRRLPVVGDDELAELARTFNGMLGRLEGAFSDLGTANQRLGQALESQRRFTADASHELRTPLTRMRLAADVGADPEATPERLRDSLAVTGRATQSMTRLVEQLLTLARVDSGQLPVRTESLDLRIAVAEALDGVPGSERVEASFADRAVMVRADADHVRRIVTNLVENALRHTPADRRISVTVQDQPAPTLEVADEGEGIPPEHVEKVFDRFHRVDTSRTGGGSGLGLAICRDLVRANGGEIQLASRPAMGTRVSVVFPNG